MKNTRRYLALGALLIACLGFAPVRAQIVLDSCQIPNAVVDSLLISEVQDAKGPDKVLHAEPLFIDLIRDLGARRGEREWNFGWGMTDNLSYTTYSGLVEYEWAPINRLGLELELPFSLYANNESFRTEPTPNNRINGLKAAAQYTYYVSEKRATSLAAGYIHEFALPDLPSLSGRNYFKGHLFNPFLVAAKRWGSNYHTLVYTGPQVFHERKTGQREYQYHINTNFHYMIPGTRNFVGLEVNKITEDGLWRTTLRPQLRLGINDHLLLGIVTAIPLRQSQERMGAFFRLIYEPRHKSRG